MKSQLEEIRQDAHSSLRIMVNPNLSDFFFWHFHPELELVYIEGADGTRHVGEHISKFYGSDLVFIGSNIPHLNFDYGIKTPYRKIVVHLRPDFMESARLNTPELQQISRLFELAAYGISFSKACQLQVAQALLEMHTFSPFQQFIEILKVFQSLAADEHYQLLHKEPVKNLQGVREKERIKRIYDLVEVHYSRKIDLQEAASLANLSKEAFCRYFKRMTRLTFTEFVNHYRIDMAKKILLQGSQINDACFECGFESISYFNRVFKRVTGTNPMAFKKAHSV
ncbi:MAG: AraC family transcriptional regulator [Cyclobacteriaceae bacterium]|nr:AraC family transcriptional regulator [Cyclobacteriaceae bacterium]